MGDQTSIMLFDGVCNFCDAAVQFIIQRDPQKKIFFTPLQSERAQKILAGTSYTHDLTTMIYIENGTLYTKSSAFLKITRHLSGMWPLLYGFLIFPRFVRDFFYDLIAKNRYKLFGKKDQCAIPTADVRDRFLD